MKINTSPPGMPTLSWLFAAVTMLIPVFTNAAPVDPAECSDPDAYLELRSQADIDSFPCTEVAGRLNINDSGASTPFDLTPLNGLTRVSGSLYLSLSKNPPANINGLENLVAVGSLDVLSGAALTDISALSNLATIGPAQCTPTQPNCRTTLRLGLPGLAQVPAWGIASATTLETLIIRDLPPPRALPGFDNLPVPSKDFQSQSVDFGDSLADQGPLANLIADTTELVLITKAPNLTTFLAAPNTAELSLREVGVQDLSFLAPGAFPALETVSLEGIPSIDGSELSPLRDLGIRNVLLTNMTGLTDLSGISGLALDELSLVSIPNLASLSDLAALKTPSRLTIVGVDSLTDLSGLEGITEFSGPVVIQKNAQLTSLAGLDNVTRTSGLAIFSISSNPELLNVDALAGLSGIQGGFEILSNPKLTDLSGLINVTGIFPSPRAAVTVAYNAVTACDVLDNNRLNPPVTPRNYFVQPACRYLSPGANSDVGALDFGSGPIGTTIDRTVTLTNPGSLSTSTNVSSVAIANDVLGEYSVLSEDCTTTTLSGSGTTGVAGNSCSITVRFTVDQTGVDQALLNITYRTSENTPPLTLPVVLVAAGTGVGGAQLSPNTIVDFGAVELGGLKTDTITIDNSAGTGPLTVSSVAVSGLNAGDFAIEGNSCGDTYPQDVPAGSSCDLTVRFTPGGLAPRTADFIVESNSATSPDKVVLLGIGAPAPAPSPATTTLNFGSVERDRTTPPIPLVISNAGTLGDLDLGALTVSGDFALVNDNCSGTTLAPSGQAGSTCIVELTFSPSATGGRLGSLLIPSTGNPPRVVRLLGTGLAPALLVAAPSRLDFGAQDGRTLARLITVSNIAPPGQDAQIDAVTVAGSRTPTQFEIVSDSCSNSTVTGLGSCELGVVFDPKSPGVETGSITLTYNGSQTLTIELSGRGGDPVSFINPPELDFGDVEVGTLSSPQTVTVSDNSGVALSISSTLANDTRFIVSNDTCSGVTVNPGGTCSFDVTFAPLTRGAATSTVDVNSDSGSSPDQVTLLARGVIPGVLAVSSAIVDFGSVLPGLTSSRTVTASNTGDAALAVGTISLTGDTALSVASDGCSGVTLAPSGQSGSTCEVVLEFAPVAAIPSAGTLSLPSAGNPPASVQLIGAGLPTARLVSAPTQISFGQQTGPTPPFPITITNIAPAGQGAQIDSVTVTGTVSPAQFSIASDSCSGAPVAAQASCEIAVAFDPAFPGVDTGSLTITYNSGETLTIALSGSGGPPVTFINPPVLDFGDVLVGALSPPQTVTVTDNGGVALSITSVISADPAFQVTNDTCANATVNPASSCSFDVSFAPTAQASAASTVSVNSDSASSPDAVLVQGRGIVPGVIHVSTPTVAFGPVPVGETSQQEVTVTNFGSLPLAPLDPVTLTGDPDFSLASNSCDGATLAAAESCSFAVVFTPSGLGAVSATVEVNPTITVTGSGVPASAESIPTLGQLGRLLLIVLLGAIGLIHASGIRRSGTAA